MFGVHGPPSPGAIWITTGLGDVFVFDPAIIEVRNIHIPRKYLLLNKSKSTAERMSIL
jgi:hypothetical protein